MKKIGQKASPLTLKDFSGRVKDVDLDTYFIFGAIILVLLLGAYALFSPEAANQRRGNPACGKIVIATDGATLRSNVAPTLQQAPYFLVVDPLSGKLIEAIKNPYRGPQPDPQITYLVAGKGEEAVIVANIDQQSYNILMQFGIRVFGGYTGQAKKVVVLYRQARISQTPVVNTVPQPGMAGQMSQPAQGVPVNAQGIQAGWGNGMGPTCPLPVAQGGIVQGGMNPAGWGLQNGMGPTCPLPVAQGGFAQGPQMQVQAQSGLGNYYCPRCRYAVTGQNFGGICPICPNCRNQMIQQNAAQGVALVVSDETGNGRDVPAAGTQVAWGQPTCPIPANQAGFGMQNGPGTMCPLPVNNGWQQGAMVQGVVMPDADTMRQANMTTQVAFAGWGEQPFVCPNCNWRLKTTRQGNSYPVCPNCGSSMALDKSSQGWWPQGGQQGGQHAANMAQMPAQQFNQTIQPQFNQAMQPQPNQMMNQPNFWQGPESTGFFLCPNCNWRMYAQQGQNEFPRCPNCGQIMARGGAYYQNQNAQQNYYNPGNGPVNSQMAPVALQVPASAPPISSNAVMPHGYRGVCSNCHQIIDAPTNNQNAQAGANQQVAWNTQPLANQMGWNGQNVQQPVVNQMGWNAQGQPAANQMAWNAQGTQGTQPAANQMMWNNMPQTQGQQSVRVGIGNRAVR